MVAGPVGNTGRVNDRTKFVNGLFPHYLVRCAGSPGSRCPYRKSNPYVLMVQPAKDRPHSDAPSALNDPSNRRILASFFCRLT